MDAADADWNAAMEAATDAYNDAVSNATDDWNQADATAASTRNQAVASATATYNGVMAGLQSQADQAYQAYEDAIEAAGCGEGGGGAPQVFTGIQAQPQAPAPRTAFFVVDKEPKLFKDWYPRLRDSDLYKNSRPTIFHPFGQIWMANKLNEFYDDGTLDQIVLMGHGVIGSAGVQVPQNTFMPDNLKDELVAAIQAKLKPGGTLIIISCGNNPGAVQRLADKLNVNIIASTGCPTSWDQANWPGRIEAQPGGTPVVIGGRTETPNK
jgi:hypothetical protein